MHPKCSPRKSKDLSQHLTEERRRPSDKELGHEISVQGGKGRTDGKRTENHMSVADDFQGKWVSLGFAFFVLAIVVVVTVEGL